MKSINLIILFLMAVLPNYAYGNQLQQQNNQDKKKKEHTVEVYGDVKDSFTQAYLKAFVTVMDKDSNVIDTMTTSGWDKHLFYHTQVPARPATYIVKAECEGYETNSINHTIKYIARNKNFLFPSLLLKKKISRDVALDGVVVTGTKVKLAYRGDTLVFNASAFNVPEGSMLDALVRQMPGAEMKSNGDIYVNGKKIDYLLLNGKDFFKGKNQVMLDNLPYYTVKELKVYDRSSEKSRLMGKEMEKKDYVMDVALKREYSRGYIANMEAAGGSEDRYLARLFGLYYTDNSRISVFGNLNNMNETRRPGSQGDWSPSNSPQGQKTTRQVGVDFNASSKSQMIREHGNVTFAWDNMHDLTHSSQENFASTGNIFGRSISDSRSDNHSFNLYNNFQVDGKLGVWLDTRIDYSDRKTSSTNRSATYSANPERWGDIRQTIDSTFAQNVSGSLHDIITNRSLYQSRSKVHAFTGSQQALAWYKLPWGDRITLGMSGKYTSSKPNESFSLNRNEYFKTGEKDLRNYYNDSRQNSYDMNASLDYGIEFPYSKWTMFIGPQFAQTYQSVKGLKYRLDELGGDWIANPELMFATLPSNMEQLSGVIDEDVSRSYQTMKKNTGGELVFRRNDRSSYLFLSLSISEEKERLNYHTSALDTIARRNRVVFMPSFMYDCSDDKKTIRLYYYMQSQTPDFFSIMPYSDNSNPLAVRVNNPDLENSLYHHYEANIRFNGLKNQQYVGFFATGNFYHNLVGTRTTYNSQTGGYTYMSDNIGGGGNWDFWTTTSYGVALDKARLFRLDYRLWFNGLRRKDFDIAYDDNSTQLCYVLRTELGNSLYFKYQKDKLSINLGGKVEWKHGTSNRSNFEKLNAYDFEYGGNMTYTLPLGISLSTDLKEYCRRGYSEKSFNTSDLVWNASLARSFCKGKLTLKAEAFDILQNLSSTVYEVGGQGKTEKWNNTLPSYAMVHLMYKFSKAPKSKK